MKLTRELFNNAVRHATENNYHPQMHLADFDESFIDGTKIILGYDPFQGNWRLTKFVKLAQVDISNATPNTLA